MADCIPVETNTIDSQEFKVDVLKLYFGKPFELKEGIIINEPTIGNILEYGEQKFFTMLNVFISNPTGYRLQLWDMGIDWNKISDFELFSNLSKGLSVDDTRILFNDVDFSSFEAYVRKSKTDEGEDKEENLLVNPKTGLEITENEYKIMAKYLRTMFNIFPKVMKVRGKFTKESIIEEDRMNLEYQKKQNKNENASFLFPLVSACVNHPGFKYNVKELEDVGIFQFMDSVARLRIYEDTVALLHGAYFADVKKVEKKSFDFMREIQTM